MQQIYFNFHRMALSVETSYVGQFQVRICSFCSPIRNHRQQSKKLTKTYTPQVQSLSNALELVLKWVAIPIANGELLAEKLHLILIMFVL